MPIMAPLYIADAFFHPNGRALYLTVGGNDTFDNGQSRDNGLYAYSIDATSGALTPAPGSPYRFPLDAVPRKVAFNPAGTTALVPSDTGGIPSPTRVNAFGADARLAH